ncbi:aspartate/glutamate racemase family protein [Mycoplana rhizolycopersici]|uniref:Aspartate/glutamate racemase family protein n=1 Tax=Mycoplana rhizolycopersici TaxID=2746702 RepID=A0ABX2QQN2_9HYPH|nr:aspartate/glutamate racemase family protein [Rhizobium rhizolycopersici]NVP58619.1 aspartate/glutamate racemase family protein [Rhizobium rhizolycopersici]
MKSLVVLFNPNTSSTTTAEMVAIAHETARNWADVEGRTADFGAPIIINPPDLDTASLAVDAFADRMAETGWPADAIVIGAFGDPGLAALRLRAPVPVVGIGESAIAEASAGGRPFSIVTTTPELETSIRRQVEGLGVCRQLRSIRLTPGVPAEVMADADRLDRELGRLISQVMAEDGAKAVLVAGGPLSAAARRLDLRFAPPIIDPVTTALKRLGLMLRAAN